MCDRCDRDLAAILPVEIEHGAKGVAAIAAHVLANSIPNTAHGVVIGAAVGHALAKVAADMLTMQPGESFTPSMSAFSKRIGNLAAERVIATYRRTAEG